MTIEQAKQLQAAVREQSTRRQRLIHAANPTQVLHEARAYIDATDRCYEIVVAIQGGE